MKMATVLRLYPGPTEEVALESLYLKHALHRQGRPGAPCVFADFVSSLDGRIAVADRVPAELTGARDLRLLLELLAQADCVITHGGYLRAIAAGRLGDILEVGRHPDGQDLRDWRRENGLLPQPAVLVASASLDFPMPASLERDKHRTLIATVSSAPAEKLRAWQSRGYKVLIAGDGAWVEGGALTHALGQLGYSSLCLLAGPRMLETMLRQGRLSRLFLTLVHRLLGGEAAQTLISGGLLGGAGGLRLKTLHYDPEGPDGMGQWFAEFEPAARGPG
jgi:riboflavin biosynthesis pyrimidine reductase